MAISEKDVKLLWGRAAGRCSKPGCNIELTKLVESGGGFTLGEMAHVIGRKPKAARGVPSGGSDTYDNLILLCPTHHTEIDTAPEGTFPAETVLHWKRLHEDQITKNADPQIFESFDQLKNEIRRLLLQNKACFDAFGPKSSTAQTNPESNLYNVWTVKRVSIIVVNNRRMISLIDSNRSLIPTEFERPIEQFRIHVEGYEHHVYERLDEYPLFPTEFPEIFN